MLEGFAIFSKLEQAHHMLILSELDLVKLTPLLVTLFLDGCSTFVRQDVERASL